MRVLVLDGHSRAALETLQSLGRAGVPVDLATETKDCLAMHSRYAVRKLQQPSQKHSEQFLAWLRAEDEKRKYTLIVPATEASLLGLRHLDESDPLRAKAIIPGDNALDIALDKQKTWHLARELGVPVPAGALLTSLADIGPAQQFPVVLKPTHSKVMLNGELQTLAVAVVKNEGERLQQLKEWLPLTPVQQQQYVSGRGAGVEFLFEHGKRIWHFAHERIHEYPLSGGASSYRRSIVPPAGMLRDAEKLLTVLEWHGVAMVEFKLASDGQYCLMEINPRLWGSLALSVDAGVDFPLGLLQIASGREPAAQPKYKAHYYTRDLRTDVEWMKSNLKADREDPLLHTRSRSYSFLEFLRPLTGRESWDHFDWSDLGVTRQNMTAIVSSQVRPIFTKLKTWRTQRRLLGKHELLLQHLSAVGGPSRVVFLCYGNICRSPLAAALARKSMNGVAVGSTGFHQQSGRSCPERMLRIGTSFGIDISEHRSTRITSDILQKADLIIAMDLENLNRLQCEFPGIERKATLLGLFSNPPVLSIADPYLADDETATRICEQVRSGVEHLSQWVANTGKPRYAETVPSAASSQ